MSRDEIVERRKEIRNQHFAAGGMLVISLLGTIGLLLFILSGVLDVTDTESLYDCVAQNGMMMIFGGFFFLIALYCWYGFIVNTIIPPKRKILYLSEKQEDECVFIDKRGKKIIITNCNKEEKKYYYVYKTKNYIYRVEEECRETIENWAKKERPSYWMNFYSPMGEYHDIMLLPIVYVIAVPGVLSMIMAKGFDKIYGLIFSAGPLFIIIYDLVCKITESKSKNRELMEQIMNNAINTVLKYLPAIATTIISSFITILFIKTTCLGDKLLFLPFLIASYAILGFYLAQIFGKEKLISLFGKLFILAFLAFWFRMLIFIIVISIKQDKNYAAILYTLPFWAVGIFLFIKMFIKKEKPLKNSKKNTNK